MMPPQKRRGLDPVFLLLLPPPRGRVRSTRRQHDNGTARRRGGHDAEVAAPVRFVARRFRRRRLQRQRRQPGVVGDEYTQVVSGLRDGQELLLPQQQPEG